MQVRTAQSSDLYAAVEVWRMANESRGMVPTREREDRVRTKLDEAGARTLVADSDGIVVGMLLFEPWAEKEPDPGRGHISMLFVHPDFWGRGVASELLTVLGIAASDAGWHQLSVWTRTANKAARRVYERCGFMTTGRARQIDGDEILELALDIASA